MKKIKVNYINDILMVIFFIASTFTGLILFFFFPSGLKGGGRLEVLGLIKNNWVFVHDWTSIAFILLILLHIILHWDWIVLMTKKIFKKDL